MHSPPQPELHPEASAERLDHVIEIAGFRAAIRTFLHRSDRVAQGHGLTPQRYLLLLMVKGAPDRSERLSVGALAERLKLSVNSVTELVDRAAAAGLVGRERSTQDARVFYVRLTREGERQLAAVVADTEDERRELVQSLEALAASSSGVPARSER